MPNYTVSRCTKPYFNIHSRDIIISHNGNHCPVLPCVVPMSISSVVSSSFLYSGSLFVVTCLGFLIFDFDLAGYRAPVQASCVSCPIPTWRSLVLLFQGAALWLQLLGFLPLVAVVAIVRRLL
jgi:hypothetical protein